MALAVLSAVVIVPIFNVIYDSFFFRESSFGETVVKFVGLENYRFVFTDPYFWRFLKQNLIYTAGSVALSFVAGFICALLLNQIRGLKSLFRGAILLPWVIPPVVAALLWKWLLNDTFGLVNYMISPFTSPVNWLGEPASAMFSLIMVDAWTRIPLITIFILAGLKSIPVHLYDAAKIDGAGPIGRFRYVTLPLLRPVIVTVLLIVSIFVFRTYVMIGGLTGGGPARYTETLISYIFKNTVEYRQIGFSSALSVIVLVGIVVYAFVFLKLFYRRWGE